MRKSEVFFEAIGYVREELIDEALDYAFYRRSVPLKRYMSLAACLALVVVLGFGAVRLGIIGGSGGSDAANNMASDTVAPESDYKGDVTEDDAAFDEEAAPGDSGEGSDSTAPETPGEAPGESEVLTFAATVVEVYDTWLLVEPWEGQEILHTADQIRVPTGDLTELPKLEPGSNVLISYAGLIQESYPAGLTEVISVEIIQEELSK